MNPSHPNAVARARRLVPALLAASPPLDTAGLTDAQIAAAQRARYLDAVLESKQRRDRRRRQLHGGRGPH
ncbi:MAG: hypothetical protein AAF328_02055 [Planctomycetota bacterium]